MRAKDKRVLFLRKKTLGENSIEELATTLIKYIPNLKLVVLPEHSTTLVGSVKNLIFAFKNRGEFNHIYSQSESYISMVLFKKTIITCHDVGSMNSLKKEIYRFLAKFMWVFVPTFFVKDIICISNNTKKEYLKICPFAKRKIRVIGNPYNPLLKRRDKCFDKEMPIILQIGTAKRKNLFSLIQAVKGVTCKLIIVGILNKEQIEMLQTYEINYTHYFDITFDKIKELYEECDIVSFPSSYEGFGMPLIEANVIGRPVIAGDIPTLREIGADAAHFIDPKNIEAFRNAINKITWNDEYRFALVEKGYKNSERFTVDKIISEYVEVYNK